MKRANEILAMARVDGRLSADGRIHLCQQRRGHLHIINATPNNRGGKSGEIADDAAAERNHEIAAFDARRDHVLADPLEHRIAFRPFPGRNDHATGLDASLRKRRLCRGKMQLGDDIVGHDRDPRTRAQRGNTSAQAGQKFASDGNVIVAPRQRHFNHDRSTRTQRHGHYGLLRAIEKCPANAAITSSTITSCDTSRDSMVRSACA